MIHPQNYILLILLVRRLVLLASLTSPMYTYIYIYIYIVKVTLTSARCDTVFHIRR